MMAVHHILDHLRQRGLLPLEEAGEVAQIGSAQEAEVISQWLAQRFGSWTESLQGLGRVGRRLNGGTNWLEACLAIRHAPLLDLALAVAKGCEQQDPSLNLLWQGVSLETYRDLLQEPGLSDSARAAYRAILTGEERTSFGRDGWLLREQEVAAVYNLLQAQRSLLRACELVLHCWPKLLAATLRGDAPLLAYWAFVLIYSARTSQPGDDDHRSARPLLSAEDWLRAWEQAFVMSPQLTLPFLLKQGPSHENLVCPVAWDMETGSSLRTFP